MVRGRAGTSLPAITPYAGQVEPRRLGVRGAGSYWGAAGEQIDMTSGNLSFSVPLVKAQGRNGWSATFALSYNSQLWRKDPVGIWKMGKDYGYGFGWKLQAGTLTAYWSDYWTVHHYVFIDATGAEYRLDVNTNGVWTSREAGVYVSYHEGLNRLYFNDGSFWVMGALAGGLEDDAGTRYPTVMQDSSGNQVKVRYQWGIGAAGPESSGRIAEIEDVRAVDTGGGVWKTYTFSYTTDWTGIPHLTGITNHINTAESYTLGYITGQPLYAPFAGSPVYLPVVSRLSSITVNGVGLTQSFEYGSNGSGELTRVVMPYGGDLRWSYAEFTFAGGRIVREVVSRQLTKSAGAVPATYTITRNPGDGGLSTHSWATVDDPGGVGQKAWYFGTDAAALSFRLETQFEDRQMPGQAVKLRKNNTWVADGAGRGYLGTVLTTLDPGTGSQKQTKTEQTVDVYGNVTQTKVYAWDSLVTPARTYTNTYLTGSSYVNAFMRNRLVSSQVTNGVQTVTLVTNTYDERTPSSPNGTPRQWDAGAAQMGYATTVVRPGASRFLWYDGTGAVVTVQDGHGHSVGVEQTSATNFAAPTAVTPNSDTSLRTTMAWNGFLGLTQETGPNGAQASITYDNYARPSQTVSPHGAVTTYVYTNSPPTTTATTNGRWVKTTFDGFGRAVKVERGDGSSTKSVVETEYESCACAALGKVKRVSQPYAPGGTVYWTVYTYDALGRTVSVAHAGGSGTTSYAYAGNTVTVTVTDAAGKWKKYWMDAMGNLVQVTEPNPGGGSNYETYYSYNVLDRLVQAQMTRGSVTQTRSWVYNGDQRLQSETHPESGTTSYTYNGYEAVTSKQPANGSMVSYGYDGYGRLTTVTDSWNVCQNMTYVYGVGTDGGNVVGRVKQVTWGDAGHASCWENPFYYKQSYTYTAGGLVTNKTLSLRTLSGPEAGLALNYTHDNEGRVTTITGPDNYTARYTYDTMGRVNWVGGYWWETFVTDVRYGAADEVTRASYLLMNVAEERTYNVLGQLTRIQAPGYVDLEYRYSATANNGQITQMKNWRSGEEVTYSYDALSRLSSAVTTGPEWGLTFGYDGFGNKLSQTVTKGQAPSMSVAVDGNNRIIGHQYDAAGNTLMMPGYSAFTYDAHARVTNVTPGSGAREVYGYDPDNMRVYVNREGSGRYLHLRGVDGKLMGIWKIVIGQDETITLEMQRTFTWFGDRDVTKWVDRLGSVQTSGRYYPYGEEYPATGNDNAKFATYWRDMTALDYAQQRYYASTLGRFVTPDPSALSEATSPGSWNLYSYVEGDPVNSNDPSGLIKCGDIGVFAPGGNRLGSLRQVFFAQGEANALGRLLWNDQRNYSSFETRTEHGYMAQAIMNRAGLLRGRFAVQGRSSRGYWGNKDISGYDPSAPHIIDRRGRRIPFWYHSQILFNAGTGTFYSILHEASYFSQGNLGLHSIGPTGQLVAADAANRVLDREIGDISRAGKTNKHPFAAPGGGAIWLPNDCAAAFSAQEQAHLVYNNFITYNRGNFFPLGWNRSPRVAAIGDGYHLGRTGGNGGHEFWGYRDWWIVP